MPAKSVTPLKSVTVRLPETLLAALEDLVNQLQAEAPPHARVNRTTVAARALELGLEQMVRERAALEGGG